MEEEVRMVEGVSEKKCLGCGACCKYLTFTPASSHVWVKDWLEAHGVELLANGEHEMLKFNIPCKNLLESGKCNIYEDRPSVCRIFPIGAIPECPMRGR